MAEWISVKDRLPTESGEYIVFLHDISDEADELFKMSDQVTVAEYDAEQKIFSWGDSWQWNMLIEHPQSYGYALAYWMPLPQPPIIEAEGEE